MATESQPVDTNASTPTTSADTTTTTTTVPNLTPSPTSIFSSLHAYPFTSDTAFLAGLSQIFGHPGTAVTEAELAQKPDLVLSAQCFYFSRKFQTPTPIDPTAYKAWLAAAAAAALSASSIPNGTATTTTTATTEEATRPNTSSPSSVPATNSNIETSTPTPQTAPAATLPPPTSTATTSPPPPPYPTSFAAIVELITNNKPIPGIEEIPTTVLELGSSKQDRATRRRKPWEKDLDVETKADTDGSAVAGHRPAEAAAIGGERGLGNAEAEEEEEKSTTMTTTEVTIDGKAEGLLRLLRPDAVPDSGLVAKE